MPGSQNQLDIIGKTDYDHASYTMAERFRADDREVMETGHPKINYEEPQVRADGSKAWLRTSKVPLRDKDGTIIGVLGTYEDITERKRAEETLKKSEERYRNVVEDQTEFISRFLPDGTHVFVNEAYCRYFRLNRDDLLGHRFRPRIPAEGQERVKRFFASLTPDHPIDMIEHRIIMPDGMIRWQRWSDRAIFDPSGTVIEYQSVGRDITEEKATEAALQESEIRFREQYQNNPLAIFTWQKREDDFVLVDCNKTAEALTSGRSIAFIGRTASELYATRPEIVSGIRHCFSERTVISKELVSEHFLPGRFIHTTATFVPPDLIMVHMEDITERKKAEEALRESEEKYRRLISNSFDAVIVHQDGRIELANDAAARIIGSSSTAELVGRPVLDFVCPEFQVNVAERVRQVSQSTEGTAPLMEEKFVRNDRTAIDVEVIATVTQHEGRPAVMVVFRDITERKRAEDILRKSVAQLKRAEEVGRSGSWELRLDDNTFSGSEGARILYGFEGTRWTIDEIQKIPLPEYRPLLDTSLRDLIAGRSPYNVEFKIRRPSDGTVLDIHSIAEDDPGQNVVFGVIRDITAQKRAEDVMRVINQKLNLLSSITRHDLRNQLTVLEGYLALLEEEHPDTSFGDHVKTINTTIQRISSIIQFTKEYEKIGVNVPVWQDCRTLVETAAKQIPLGRVRVKNDLPPGREVFADPLIVKVCYNLMDNAVRYGGKITTIRFSGEERNGVHVVVCEDDGEGVPADEKERIFERGFGRNTGLGLFLVHEILDITGITIRETGEPGKGARFEMTVPKDAYRLVNVQNTPG